MFKTRLSSSDINGFILKLTASRWGFSVEFVYTGMVEGRYLHITLFAKKLKMLSLSDKL